MDVVAATESLSISGNSPAVILLGLAALAVMYIMVRPRKKKEPLGGASFVRSSLAQQKALERDMQNVIVELSDLTRQMSAQMDTRAAKIELLIRDADERIAALADAQAKAPPLVAMAGAVQSAEVPAMRLVKHDEPTSEDRWNEVYRLAESGATIGEICRQLNRPRGEVELILALRPKSAAPAAELAVAVG